MPRASRHSLRPSRRTLHQLGFVGALQVGDGAIAALRQPLLGRRPDAEDEADRLVGKKARASSWPSTAKPRGLSRSEAILARNLLQESPTETVMPISRSTSRAKRASTFAGDHAVHPFGAGQSRKASSIDERLDQRRQRLHSVAHLAADADIFRHVGRDHDRRAGTAPAP